MNSTRGRHGRARSLLLPVVTVLAVGIVTTVALALIGISGASTPRPSLLEAGYFAAGILLALVGMLAVLQLWLTESHERDRNHREAVDMTLQQCELFRTSILPLLEKSAAEVDAFTAVLDPRPAWLPPSPDSCLTTAAVHTAITATQTRIWEAKRLAEAQLDWEVRRDAGFTKIGQSQPPRPTEPPPCDDADIADLENHIDRELQRFAAVAGGSTAQTLLPRLESFAAYLVRGESDLDLAAELIGHDYLSSLYRCAPVIGHARAAAERGRPLNAIRLYGEFLRRISVPAAEPSSS